MRKEFEPTYVRYWRGTSRISSATPVKTSKKIPRAVCA